MGAAGRTAADIDALLPQTQCTRCGYAGCRPYAEAIERGEARINQCPPGGAATIAALAALLGREPLPLDPAHGTEGPALVARIDEERCIGCAKCLPPCPVDAIVGAARRMHTVIAALCTGCELCVAPCPVDCIAMVPASGHDAALEAARATEADRQLAARLRLGPHAERFAQLRAAARANRERYEGRNRRIERRRAERAALLAAKKQAAHGAAPAAAASDAP